MFSTPDALAALPLAFVVPAAAVPPSLADNTADLDRLRAAARSSLPPSVRLRIALAGTAQAAARFRAAGFRGWAVVHLLPDEQAELAEFLPNRPAVLPGLALDLGSTHLEASLIDLSTGSRLARGMLLNPQVEHGADILSRIHLASQAEGLAMLQQAAVRGVNSLVEQLCRTAGVRPEEVRTATMAGNTAMTHLLLGLSPFHLCREPYIPVVNAPDPFRASEIGLRLHPLAMAWIMPCRGSYFGGDLTAGIVATGLDRAEQPSMLVDVGTNAEVVLGCRDWLIACAGAAGPALEGGVARMGMRAGAGAIDRVAIDHANWQLRWHAIGDGPPCGICGSGLIDLAAELYLARIIDQQGRLQAEFPGQSAAHKQFVEERLLQRDGETVFLVARTKTAEVTVGQIDLDAMMRSKAAMHAILETLAAQVGVQFGELERIAVAGAFGRHIDPRKAVTLGMLPDLPAERFRPVGNASLRGAEMLLLDRTIWERSQEVCRRTTYVELNVNHEFMLRFSGSRFIPHTDPERFPSVPTFG